MKRKKTAILALSTSIFSGVQAANLDNDTTVNELNPVVITGTGTYHKYENSPVAVNVVTAKELKDAGVTNLQDALNRLSTSVTTHTNGMGTFVNFNGISDDYVLILENGQRVSGDDRWNRISLDNVKRIEVFSGAASALYGSDAMAGVVNIITDDSKNTLDASTFTKVLSKGRFTQDVNVDANVGKFSTYTSYNHRQADNWQVNHYQSFDEGDSTVMKLTGRPMSTAFRSDNISEKLGWKFNNKWSVYLKGNYYDYKTFRPQNATYFSQKATTDKTTGEKSYTYTEKQAYTYDLHHVSYNYGAGARFAPSSKTHLYLDVFCDNFSSKYNYWQTNEAEAYEETRKRTHNWNENLKGIFRLTDWNKLSAGVELLQESLDSESDNIDDESTNTYNLYAQDEIDIVKGLEGLVGVRYTYNDNFGSHFTPNLGLFYHIGGFRVRASYAGGYRTPTLSQLYATDQAKTTSRYTMNNTSLEPEKNNFYNANAEYSNKWMKVGVGAFMNKIEDMINYRTMTQEEIDGSEHLTELYNEGWTTIRQRDNIDEATLKGFNANLKFILPFGLTVGGGYTYTNSNAKTKTLATKTQTYEITENPVDKSVKNVYHINAAYDKTWGCYHLNISLNGSIQDDRYSSTYGYADGYSQWDLSTSHAFDLKDFILEPGFGIENLFDTVDDDPWNSNFSTINPGRSFYVSLALKFKK